MGSRNLLDSGQTFITAQIPRVQGTRGIASWVVEGERGGGGEEERGEYYSTH